MPSCPQHPRIHDQPCTCAPPSPSILPKTRAIILTAFVAISIVIGIIILLYNLIHITSSANLQAFLVTVIVLLVGLVMGILGWAWRKYEEADFEEVNNGAEVDPPDYQPSAALLSKSRS